MKIAGKERGQINLAELMTVMTFLGTPLVMVMGAASAGSERLGVVFFLVGIPVGCCLAYCVRTVAYLILSFGDQISKRQGAIRWLGVPAVLGYLTMPPAMMMFGMYELHSLTKWIVRRFL